MCPYCLKKGHITKVCKPEKKNCSVQGKANLIQEAESDKDEVFRVFHQRIIGGKMALCVAKMKMEKENAALETDTLCFNFK